MFVEVRKYYLPMRSPKSSPSFRKGWNTALKAVPHGLRELSKSLPKTRSVRLALETVETMIGAMAAPPPRYFATNRELAEKYGTSERTITNWRREGCPFESGKGAVMKWVAARRYAPAGMEEKFGTRLLHLRVRRFHGEVMEGFALRRRLKLLRKHYGSPPDPDDERLRCPKGGMSNPKVLALKELIDTQCPEAVG